MISSIKAFGKFLDQPMLISTLNKHMPKIVSTGAVMYLGYDYYKNSNNNKDAGRKLEYNKNFLKKTFILAGSILSAFMAPKIASAITKRATLPSFDKVKNDNINLIDNFISSNKLDDKTTKILNSAKEKPLSFKKVKFLNDKFKNDEKGSEFFKKFIPDPENIKAKDIFSEIGYLSIYGAVPVIGGIASGIAADGVDNPKTIKEKIPDKINEGLYQYLANIFMCNVGAGAALGILEKLNITSKTARALGMTAGIILTGVLGGAKIANTISKKIINPFLSKNNKLKERKPEPMDLCMHTDDIATVSLLSGLKWIEPSLPILYSVSGYKAGMGYRN